jgi:hypothetical protein
MLCGRGVAGGAVVDRRHMIRPEQCHVFVETACITLRGFDVAGVVS